MTTKTTKLAQRLASGGTFTATITKRDGTHRQMRFQIERAPRITFAGTDRSPRITVQDLDRGESRTLRLDAVHQLTEVPREKAPSPRPGIIDPSTLSMSEMEALFY